MRYTTPEIEMLELEAVDVILASIPGDGTTTPDIELPDDALPVG